jgi:hypothetical protein
LEFPGLSGIGLVGISIYRTVGSLSLMLITITQLLPWSFSTPDFAASHSWSTLSALKERARN